MKLEVGCWVLGGWFLNVRAYSLGPSYTVDSRALQQINVPPTGKRIKTPQYSNEEQLYDISLYERKLIL